MCSTRMYDNRRYCGFNAWQTGPRRIDVPPYIHSCRLYCRIPLTSKPRRSFILSLTLYISQRYGSIFLFSLSRILTYEVYQYVKSYLKSEPCIDFMVYSMHKTYTLRDWIFIHLTSSSHVALLNEVLTWLLVFMHHHGW